LVRLLIDGELREAEVGQHLLDNINPATEEVLGQVADASVDEHAPGDCSRAPSLRRTGLASTNRAFRPALASSPTASYAIGERA
jgi:aldehyde dehydrogenase (NAD+)